MSLPKALKIRFNDNETEAPIFEKYDDLVSFIKNHFSIDDNKISSLSTFYYDEDGDQISFQNQMDYILYLELDFLEGKRIECEIVYKENQDISIEKVSDPKKNGTTNDIKKPEQIKDLNKKYFDISPLLGDSLYNSESLNNAMIFQIKKIKNLMIIQKA